jgi:adenylate kinase
MIDKHIIIFIGPPGSGKGSLSQLCVKKLGWAQLSTGDLCRSHIADKTEIGKQIDLIIQSGKLISDDLMIEMVEGWLLKKFQNLDVLILDGFPRTIAQAQALSALLKKAAFASVKLHLVLLSLGDEIVEHRLTSRLVCPAKDCGAVYSKIVPALAPQVAMICDKCPGVSLVVRSDDTSDAVKRRLKSYHKHAQEIVDYYKDIGQTIYELTPDRPLKEVFEGFVDIMGGELSE